MRCVRVLSCHAINPLFIADIYGKRLRSYFYRHDLLAMFGVR